MATPDGGIPRRNPAPSEAQWLARILDVVPGGIVQITADGAIARANEQARRFYGLPWHVIRDRPMADVAGRTFREDGSPCPLEESPGARCLATGQIAGPSTIGVLRPSGEMRWAIFTAVPLPELESGRLGAVVTFVDITDRRRAEVRGRAHDRLLEALRMLPFRDDPGASLAVFREPLASICELTRSERGFIGSLGPSGSPPAELRIHARLGPNTAGEGSQPPVALDALTREVLDSGRARVVNEPGPLFGGFCGHRPRTAAVLPLVTAGSVVGVVGLADAQGYDLERIAELEPLLAACADLVIAIDERRARQHLRAQLAQAERLASVGTLAAGMAHEINNPLAYVLLNLQSFSRRISQLSAALERTSAYLERSADETARASALELLGEVEDHVARIDASAIDAIDGVERVHRIVRDLMTFSRVTEEEPAVVDVNAALEVALKLAHHEIKYRARLTRELGELAPVLGNDGRLSQVFLNLLINAARAIEEGCPDENEILVRTWMEDEEVHVEVRDTGHGVAREHLRRVFEPFFSTRTPSAGAGLGLSICHNIVRAHGGRIDVESELNVGTKFVVHLPAAKSLPLPAPAQAMAVAVVAQPAPERRLRVLVVDDEPIVVRVLSQLLSRSYEVVCADGYASATGTMAADAGFDVILCDMMMLDGTGVDVHAWVAEHRPELSSRMVFMTGGSFTPRAHAFLEEVGRRRVMKPFSLAELEEVFRTVLG